MRDSSAFKAEKNQKRFVTLQKQEDLLQQNIFFLALTSTNRNVILSIFTSSILPYLKSSKGLRGYLKHGQRKVKTEYS